MDFARYQASTYVHSALGLTLEWGRMSMPESFLEEKKPLLAQALAAMQALEAGSIANPDENRQVGHYWLRAPHLAPSESIRSDIEATLAHIIAFTRSIHRARRFQHLLIIGIGGSALGPQFLAQALDLGSQNLLTPHFLDNTDPQGIRETLQSLPLKKTLVVTISKSGTTPETRNGLRHAQDFFARQRLPFARHAVAITQEGSQLHTEALAGKWLATFPMWDWVGGRTSVCSAVGLLPLALQGVPIADFLQGAATMDAATRHTNIYHNPAALLALSWHFAGGGVGAKAMVVLPYKDRLSLFSRYLQQLIMESLGKANDLEGRRVHQGLTVYGNKGSTDQHAYIQQLRDGLNNFFATFIEVQKEDDAPTLFQVEPGITSGDYLQGFCLGTTVALQDNFRQSLTLILRELSPATLGALIALFERAVGLYAFLIGINAYHQPGVEAGKKAAAAILTLKRHIVDLLKGEKKPLTLPQIAQALGAPQQASLIYRIVERLASHPAYGIIKTPHHEDPFQATYTFRS